MVNFFGSDQIKSVQNGSSLDFYLSKHVNIEKCHDYHENKHVQAQGSRPRDPNSQAITPVYLAYPVYPAYPTYPAYPVYPML